MEHILVKKSKNNNWKKFTAPTIDITPMWGYWQGGLLLVPKALELIANTKYQNNKILSWYDRQKKNHDKVMAEFKRIFGWQKN